MRESHQGLAGLKQTLSTVMIRFSARGTCLLLVPQGRAFSKQGAYWGQGAYVFFEKQANVRNKALIFI